MNNSQLDDEAGGYRGVLTRASSGHRKTRKTGRLLGPLGALAAVASRVLPFGGGNANALRHEATNTLHHQGTGSLGHETANTLGHEAASAGGTGPPTPQGQSSTAQNAGIAAVVAALILAALALLALTRDREEEPVDQDEVAAPTTIAPVPDPPASGPGEFATSGMEVVTGNVLVDADEGTAGGALVVIEVEGSTSGVGSVVTLASGATVTIEQDGEFRYQPADSFLNLASGESASDEFTYTVSDGSGWSEVWTATVTVAGVNDEPSLGATENLSLREGASASVELFAADPDSDALRFSLGESTPPFVYLTDTGNGSATLSVSPRRGDSGTYEITITATDDGSPVLSTAVTILITVTPKPVPAPKPAPDPVRRVREGLSALYHFDEGSGASVADSSGVADPMDLSAMDPLAVRWGDGVLSIDSPTVLSSVGAGSKIVNSVLTTNEVTVEAWVTPANVTQSGPARVVSLSADVTSRNTTLGQGGPEEFSGDRWSGRMRSTATSLNGLPTLSTPQTYAEAGRLTHLVLTRSSDGEVNLYVDGIVAATGTAAGDLSNWDPAQPLLLGNEATGERPWLGTFHLVAVYSKALSAAEVDQNHRVGP